jgi:protein TonB
MTPDDPGRDGESLRQIILRWTLAAAFVVLVHGGVALAIAHWPKPESTSGEPPAAVMIELAPLPVAPEVPPQEVAVGVQQEQIDESTPSEAKEEPVKEERPEPEVEPVKAEPPKEPPPEPVDHKAETELDIPELPQIDTAAAVLEAPTPPPPKPEKVEKKPEEKKKVEKKPKPKRKSVAQSASAPKPVDTSRARTNAAPTSGLASSMSVATWRGSVMAHLNRHKRYPGSGGGTSSVAFTIDRSGRVLSARLIRSSGSAVLDQEAMALARRASPVPAPPANIGGGGSVVLTVPIRFSR